MPPTQPDVRYRARTSVAIRQVGTELYLCAVGWDTDVFRLTGMLTVAWDSLQEPRSISELVEHLGATSPQDRSWVSDALLKLDDLDLVEVV